MNTPTPVVMPSPVWNPNYQQPDLGGSAYTQMANSFSKQLDESSRSLGDTFKQQAGTSQLLQTLGQAKDPTTGKPLIDPDMMQSIATKGLPAQQKFLGMAMSTVAQQQSSQNELTAQQKMLQMYQQNPALMQQKLLMQTTPGQRPPMGGGGPQITQTPAPQPTAPAPQQQKSIAPTFLPPPGVDMTTEQHNGNTVYALRRPAQQGEKQGQIIHVVNPDGTPYMGQ